VQTYMLCKTAQALMRMRKPEAHPNPARPKIGFDCNFPDIQGTHQRIVTLNFINSLGFVSQFSVPTLKLAAATGGFGHQPLIMSGKTQATLLVSVKDPLMMERFSHLRPHQTPPEVRHPSPPPGLLPMPAPLKCTPLKAIHRGLGARMHTGVVQNSGVVNSTGWHYGMRTSSCNLWPRAFRNSVTGSDGSQTPG
jgi:hypothetical protein